jgi:hypothetical protein
VITVIFIEAVFDETNRGERLSDCAAVRGIVSVTVPVFPESGVVVAGAETGGATADPPPPPPQAAMPPAMTITEPATSVRVFMKCLHSSEPSMKCRRAAATDRA